MRFDPDTRTRISFAVKDVPPGQVANATIKRLPTMPRLASVERSLCTRRGVAPARGKPKVLSMPLWYLSRVSLYILYGSGETPSSSSKQSHQTQPAHGLGQFTVG